MSCVASRVTLVRMRNLLLSTLTVAVLPWTILAQDAKPFLGRWDMTVTPATGNPYPQWMELTENNAKVEGRVQPRGGAWRPIVGASIESGRLMVSISAAGRGPAVSWELTSASPDKLTG